MTKNRSKTRVVLRGQKLPLARGRRRILDLAVRHGIRSTSLLLKQFCVLALILALAGFVTGCFPLGSTLGKEQLVAKRSGPDGQEVERVVGVPTEHHWMLLVAPDGPEFNYVLNETWRFYLVGADGQRREIPCLKKKSNSPSPWEIVAPVSNTKLWVALEYIDHAKDAGHYDYRVICFTPAGVASDEMLDTPGYGEWNFDATNHALIHKMKSGSRSYDVLNKMELR